MSYELMYGGKDLSDFGIVWDGEATFDKPAVSFKRIKIPNRNGDIFDIENRFENIPIKYRCYIPENFKSNLAELVDYLTSFKSYQKLQSTLDVGTYRQAVFVSAISPETDGFARRGGVDLVFDCKPQNYFESGEDYTQIKTNLQGNQWNDTGTQLDDNLTLSVNGGCIYILSGTKSTPQQIIHNSQVTIPSAGTWRITARVDRPETSYLGSLMTVVVGNESMKLNTYGQIVTDITTAGQSTVLFSLVIDPGYMGTVYTQFTILMMKVTESTAFENPSLKSSMPLITYDEVGHAMRIFLNGSRVIDYTPPTGAADSDGTLYIDCELLECYLMKPDSTVERYNSNITFTNDYPLMQAGTNTMYTTYGTVRVAPRWWRL